ncbi:MAG: hypothetical protein IJW20_00465 [Clostridia bacterium]|nr:hypothetical protein [Clostridia bacterium]
MKEKILKNRNLIDFVVIIFVAVLIGLPLLSSKLDVYYDDGIQHIARAYGTAEAIKENFLFPNVISSFTNSYGYSWNLFYGPLTTYGIIAIRFIVRNYIVAYKIFVLISMFLSGFFMYKFMKNLTRNSEVALLSSILYMSFPYHLTDLYTRNAVGEFTSFMFIPLVFLGLYNLFNTSDKNYYLAVGAIGLILTHNLSTAIVAIFGFIYLLINIDRLKDSKVRKGLLINICFIVLVTSFYWVPLIETKLAADYQVYESGMMSTSEKTAGHGLNFTQLFVTSNDGSAFVFELGPHILIMLAFSVMAFNSLKPELKKTYIFLLICGLVTLWMSTKYFPWKYLPEQLSIIQFPWRLLMMSAFFLSTVCAMNMGTIIKKFSIKDVIVLSIISTLYILAFYNILTFYSEEKLENIENINMGNVTGREYETVAGIAKAEYLPVNAYKNRFYVASREKGIYVLSGKAIIENESKDGYKYVADLETGDAEYTVFELPYIYYPGYEVRLDGMITESFETENGFLGIAMGKDDSAKLEVDYTGTTAMKASMFISIISFIGLAIYIFKRR